MPDTIQLANAIIKKRTKGDSKKPIFAPAQAEGLREVAALVTINHSTAAIKVAKNLLKLADYLESDERKEKTRKAIERKNKSTAKLTEEVKP